MATKTVKAIKVPGTKTPKLGMKLPTPPKAPQLGTATQNLSPYKAASKMPMAPKPPKFSSNSVSGL